MNQSYKLVIKLFAISLVLAVAIVMSQHAPKPSFAVNPAPYGKIIIDTAVVPSPTQSNLPLNVTNMKYHIKGGDLTINGSFSGDKLGVIFIDRDLFINADISRSYEAGLVFVAKGNIVISQNVSRIDAVLISEGNIFTAGDGCFKNSVSTKMNGDDIETLIVNGSLVSLNPDTISPHIIFCRSLSDNTLAPSEKVNMQAKYLVILKDIFSNALSIRYDDTNFPTNLGVAPLPPLPPPPPPPPPPILPTSLTNGDFTSGLASWGCDEVVAPTTAALIGCTTSSDKPSDSTNGSAQVLANYGGTFQLSQGPIIVTPGQTYCLSGWVKKGANVSVSARLKETTALDSVAGSFGAITTFTWEFGKTALTFHTSQATIQLRVQATSSSFNQVNQSGYFDLLTFTPGFCP